MNELQKLYDVLVREGKYTKSFEEFQNQWNDEQYQSKVYEVVHRDGLYTKDRESFNQKYGAKSQQQVQQQPAQEDQGLVGNIKSKFLNQQPQQQPQRELPRMPKPGELANIGKEDENATFDSQGNYNPINALPESVRVGAKERIAENKAREEAKKKEVLQSDLSSQQSLVESTARQQEEASSSASQRYEAAAEKFPILRNELLKDVYQQLQKEQDLPDFVKNQLNQITPDLINLGEYGPGMSSGLATLAAASPLAVFSGAMSQNVAGLSVEEAVVPKMNYMFGPLGFTFEESGATGDYMTVTAPNKDKIEISLNNFTQSSNAEEAKKLKNFIASNSTKIPQIEKVAAQYAGSNAKISSEKDVDNAISKVNNEYNALNADAEVLTKDINVFENELNAFNSTPEALRNTPEYIEKKNLLDATLLDINKRRQDLISKNSQIQANKAVVEKSVGKYAQMKAEQGTWTGATYTWLGEGVSTALTGLLSASLDLTTLGGTMPTMPYYTEEMYRKDKKESLTAVREGIQGTILDPNTTVEWRNLAEESFWGGAYAGLVKSAPAMVAPGGWVGRTAAFFGQSTDAVNQEMDNNPEFENISTSERLLVTVPIGIANAVLEEIGLSNLIKNKGFVSSLVTKAMSKAGVNATETSLSKIIKNDVESMLARGTLTLAGAGLAEAETGVLQQVGEYAVKDIYNMAKEKEMFDTPDSLKEYALDILKAGAQEAVGGMIMGTYPAAAAAYRKRGFEGMSDDDFRTFEATANDGMMQSAYISTLKTKVASGDMTMAEAKEELNDYRRSVGVYRSVDTELSTEAKKKAMNLIREKQSLKQQIEGKDEAIVSRQKKRIEEINVQLNNLSENAVQKQTTSEVPIQSETAVSEEVAGGKPTAESQVTTEKGKEEVVTTTRLTEPTAEEILTDIQKGNTVTFKYENDEQVPEDLKKYIVTRSKVNGKSEVRVVMAKVLADYIIQEKTAGKTEITTTPTAEVTATEEVVSDIDTELKIINESIGRVKQEFNQEEDDRTLSELADKVAEAKRNLSKAEDTDAAVNELKKAEKEKSDFEESLAKRKNFNVVDNLISDEIESSKKDAYEYKDLFEQDPRLAAMQSAKDMIEFAKENPDTEVDIAMYENDIKLIEEDIAKFPVKATEQVIPSAKAAPAPKKRGRKKSAPVVEATPVAEVTPAEEVTATEEGKKEEVATPNLELQTKQNEIKNIDVKISEINDKADAEINDLKQVAKSKTKEAEHKIPKSVSSYLSTPNSDGSFNKSSEKTSFTSGASMWAFEPIGNNRFNIYIANNDDASKLALAFPIRSISPIFPNIQTDFSSGELMNGNSLKTIDPAVVELQGDRYVLISPGKIDLDNKLVKTKSAEVDQAKIDEIEKRRKENLAKYESKKKKIQSELDALNAKATPTAEVTPTEEAPKRMTREEIRAKEKEIAEENKKAKENRGKNINIKDYKRTKKRGQDLKIGDVYVRRIGDSIYVFKVLSKLRKYNGQFYNMDVEVLHIGNDYIQQELDSDNNIKEIGRKVGQKTIDTFKNMSSGTGKFNFGEVTVLENFEAAPEAKTEVAPEAAPAVKEAPVAEAAPAAEEKPTAKPKEEPAKGKSLLTDKVRKQIDDIAKAWKKTREKYIKRTGEEPESDIELEIHVYNGDGEQDIDDTIEFTGVKNIDKVIEQIRKQYPNLGRIDFKYPERADGKDWNWITIYEVPAPAAEAAPAPKAEPAPTPAPAPAKEVKVDKQWDEEMQSVSMEIDYHQDKIEQLKEEIEIEKGNTKEGIAEIKEKMAKIRESVTNKETRRNLLEELETELEDFKESQADLIQQYKDDIVQEKADMKKAQKRLDKLIAKKEQATQPEAAPKKPGEMSMAEVEKRFPLVAKFLAIRKYGLSKVTARDSLNMLAMAYDNLMKFKIGAEELLLQIEQIEDLVEALDQGVKKVSKEEFKKQIAASGDFTKAQLKIFNALVDSLQTETMPEYISEQEAAQYKTGENFYMNSLNQIISKEPNAFIHEIGHFAFYKILSKEDRLKYYRYMIDSTYGKGKPSLASRLALSADRIVGRTAEGQEITAVFNVADNFSEYFAEQFRQWYMSERLFPKEIDTIFGKVAQFFNLFIEKLKSGKYVDQNLSEYFNKISAKIEKQQKKNQKIQEELGIEETMMNELQDLEDFFGIDPAISPMSMRYDTPLQKMALMYNMTESGFFPRNASEPHINKDFFQFGLKAKRASSGSYYLVNINTGKMVKPLQRPKGGIPPQVSRMSVTPISVKDMAMEDVIDTARENGFSDDTIKALLIKRGYDPKEVDSALTFNVNFASAYTNNNPTKDSPLPQAFRTIDGGVSDGIKLFFDVRNALIDFAQTTKKKGMKAGKRVRTYAEIRAKAIELLEANPIFQAQTDTKQKELIAAFDKTLNIKRGKLVSAQIAEIRKALKERLVGMKDLKKAQLILRNFIRQSLPAVKVPRVFFTLDGLMSPAEGINYYNNLRKQVYDFARTGADGKMGKKILKTSEEIKDFAISLIKDSELYKKQTTDVQSDMVNGFINSEYTKGLNNTLDIYSQKEVNKLIDIVSQTDAKNLLAQAEKVFDIITEQRNKIKAGLLKEMMTLVNKKAKAAITTTGKRRANGLDAQGQSFYQAIKPIIKAAITNDQQALDKIAEELSDTDAIDEVLAKQEVGDKLTTKEQALIDKVLAFDTFGDILNMELEEVQNLLDGLKGVRSESIVRLNEKRAERAAQREAMTEEADNQIRDGYEMLFNADGTPKDRNQLNQDKAAIWQAFKDRKVWSSLKQWLDRYDFVTSPISDYFRKKLAHLGTISNILDKTGTFFTDNLYRALNRMDESNKTAYLNEMSNLDDMANSIKGVTKGYKQIRRMIESVGVVKMFIDGKNVIYNGDQLLRIYALSLNEVQRNKLKNMGFTEDKINDIKKKLGPETIEFADKLVEYFSNEYFESINDIYALVNDVNLGYVENYFPTQTLAAKVDGKLLEDGDFNGIFNAESSPAFKERTDMSSPVDLSASFTNVVESHFQAMERYKAYAVGVKRLNDLFKIPSVNVLLEETGLKSITKNLVNMSVNPNAGVKQTQTKLSAAMNKFSGYALAFKLAQIPKQATAIVAAYEDYQFLKGRKMPALDTAMFIIDVAKTLTLARYNFNKFYNLSGNFRDRVNKGVEGDVYGLESGGKIFKPLSQKATRLADVKRFIKSAAASPTMVGDIISVYGYMANYNRDIANGMSPEAALEKFNNYNATLQSRRATDKSTLQFSQNELTRAFTMFGSTGLLQVNKVAMAYKNIMRSIANGKVPSGKDTRAFALNLGVANALFVGASYIFALIKGDDEDKEKVIDKMFEALVGLNLLYQIPLIGGAAEEVANAIKGEKTMGGDVTNPYTSVFRKIKKQYDEDNNVIQNFRPVAEFALGMQFDPFIGLYEGVTDEFNDDVMYDILGISPSYRPQNASSLEKMNKTELKKYNPDEYERLYGPGSEGYDEEQAKKEAKAAERKARKDAMDDYYNYSSGDGVKRGGSRIGGRGGSRTGGSRTK